MSLQAKKEILEVIKDFKFIMIDYNELMNQVISGCKTDSSLESLDGDDAQIKEK